MKAVRESTQHPAILVLFALVVSGCALSGANNSGDDEGTMTSPPAETTAPTVGPAGTEAQGRTTTSAPVEATTTTQGGPASTTATKPPTTESPKQRVVVIAPDGAEHEIQSDTRFPTTLGLIDYDLQPVAVDTGLDVVTQSATPGDVCGPAEDAGTVHLFGTAGDVCKVRLSVDAAGGFEAVEYVVEIEFESQGHVGWTIESGPPQQGCVKRGASLDDLVIAATTGTDSLQDVRVINELEVLVDEKLRDLQSFTVEITIATDAPLGEDQAGVTIGFSDPGPGIETNDEPTEFEWDVLESCP